MVILSDPELIAPDLAEVTNVTEGFLYDDMGNMDAAITIYPHRTRQRYLQLRKSLLLDRAVLESYYL